MECDNMADFLPSESPGLMDELPTLLETLFKDLSCHRLSSFLPLCPRYYQAVCLPGFDLHLLLCVHVSRFTILSLPNVFCLLIGLFLLVPGFDICLTIWYLCLSAIWKNLHSLCVRP